MVEKTQWAGFKGRLWKEEINVRDFVQNNYKPYDGDESSLQVQQKQLISFGENYRNFRKKRELRAEF